eukprot:1196260-Prorocentrum_minimum.AAC.8
MLTVSISALFRWRLEITLEAYNNSINPIERVCYFFIRCCYLQHAEALVEVRRRRRERRIALAPFASRPPLRLRLRLRPPLSQLLAQRPVPTLRLQLGATRRLRQLAPQPALKVRQLARRHLRLLLRATLRHRRPRRRLRCAALAGGNSKHASAAVSRNTRKRSFADIAKSSQTKQSCF